MLAIRKVTQLLGCQTTKKEYLQKLVNLTGIAKLLNESANYAVTPRIWSIVLAA